MFVEYATVTRSNNQNLDCVGNTTQRPYRNVEVLEDANIDSPPRVGEVGMLIEISNGEYAWLGRLKQFQSSLLPNEVRIHPRRATGIVFMGGEENLADQEVLVYRAEEVVSSGKAPNESYDYKIGQLIKITKEGDILIRQQDKDTAALKAEIKLSPDGTITVEATGTINVTAPLINLN